MLNGSRMTPVLFSCSVILVLTYCVHYTCINTQVHVTTYMYNKDHYNLYHGYNIPMKNLAKVFDDCSCRTALTFAQNLIAVSRKD